MNALRFIHESGNGYNRTPPHTRTHNVRLHRTGVKHFHHPAVGALGLAFDAMELPADGLTVTSYSAEPGSSSEDALKLLASWAVTSDEIDRPEPAQSTDGHAP